MTPEQIINLTKQCALLLEKMEIRAQKNDNEAEKNIALLQQSIENNQKQVAQMLATSQTHVLKETEASLKKSRDTQTAEVEKQLKFMLDEIQTSRYELNQERIQTAKKTRFLTWQALISTALAFMLLAGITT